MADIYTTIATAQNTANVASRGDGNLLTGNMVFAKCQFSTASTTAAGDVVYLAKLPKGATLVPGASFINTEDCGTDVSIKIGDADTTADDDRYSGAVSLSTAGKVAFASGVADSVPHTLASSAWIKGIIVDAGSYAVASTPKSVTVWLAYIMP